MTVAEIRKDYSGCFIEHGSEIRVRGHQTFAHIGHRWYDITPVEAELPNNRGHFHAEPLIVEGEYWHISPDEGEIGMICAVTRTDLDGHQHYHESAIEAWGWIREEEIDQPSAQIAENIADEWDNGTLQLPGRNA